MSFLDIFCQVLHSVRTIENEEFGIEKLSYDSYGNAFEIFIIFRSYSELFFFQG